MLGSKNAKEGEAENDEVPEEGAKATEEKAEDAEAEGE